MKITIQKTALALALGLAFTAILSGDNKTPLTRGSLDYATATPLTITKPGTYKITGHMSATDVPIVQITADNVELDLNGNTLNGGTIGINVTGNFATIKNGTIQNTTSSGITLDNVTGCKIDNCDIIGSATGISLNNAHQNIITNIRSSSMTAAGLSLVSSCTNTIATCSIKTIASNSNAYGISAVNGSNNTITNCAITGCTTSSTEIDKTAYGCYFLNETTSLLSETIINNISTLNSNAGAYGIRIISGSNNSIINNSIHTVATADNDGVGLKADSTQHHIAGNYAGNNDINYEDIENSFITSQANARGVYNIDESLTTPDSVNEISSKIDIVYEETWSIESKCEVISDKIELIPSQYPIEQATIARTSDASATISQPGSYFLRENISGNITISADNVTLDLNGFTVSNSTNGIVITGDNVTVKNGIISSMSGVGIYANNVSSCSIEACDVLSTSTGILFNDVSASQCLNVHTRNQNFAGFSLVSSSTNYFENCHAEDVVSTTSAYGFASQGGTNNIFYQCSAKAVQTTAGDSIILDIQGMPTNAVAAGFYFDNNEQASKVIDCISNDVSASNIGNNLIAGICFDSMLTSSILDPTVVATNAIPVSYPWSTKWLHFNNKLYLASTTSSHEYLIYQFTPPNNLTNLIYGGFAPGFIIYDGAWLTTNNKAYLALGGTETPDLRVYEFTDTPPTLDLKDTATIYGNIASLAWLSQDSTQYLAAGGSGTEINIFSFDGDTVTSVTQSIAPENTVWSVSWLRYNNQTYLAAGGQGTTNTLKIFLFDGSALTEIANNSDTASIRSVSWLIYNGIPYIAAATDTNGTPPSPLDIYSFNPASGLSLVTTYDWPDDLIYSVDWLLHYNTPYLLASGRRDPSLYNLRLFTFNGSTLSLLDEISTFGSSTTTAVPISWYVYGGIPYFATGSTSNTEINVFQFTNNSSSNKVGNIATNNITQQTNAPYASLYQDDTGTGVYADSNLHCITQNLSCNNGYNYQLVNQQYYTSQANTHGVDNTDCADEAVDSFNNKLDIIIAGT